jgi:hypothetical protein
MMKNDKEKEKWVDEMMGSLEGLVPATPSADLFEKVMAQLNHPQTTKVIPLYPKQWAAAAILLLALNIGSVVYFNSERRHTRAAAPNPFAAEIQSESTYNY